MDSSIADELNLLRNTKSEIAAAIAEMGVEVPTSEPFSGYPSLIKEIKTGDDDGYEDWGTIYCSYPISGQDRIIKIDLTNEDDFNALCSSNGATSGITIGALTIRKDKIFGFRFGDKCTSVGDYFLAYTNILEWVKGIENVKAIGSNFLYACQKVNCDLNFENIETIGNSFISTGTSSEFNGNITFGNRLTSIGSYFMASRYSFAKPLTIPSSVTNIGDAFMRGCENFVGPLTVKTLVSPTDVLSLSTSTESSPMYTQGVTLLGKGAKSWKNALPDRDSGTYRKLILGA